MKEDEKRALAKITAYDIDGINARNLQEVLGNESGIKDWVEFWSASYDAKLDKDDLIINEASDVNKPMYLLGLDLAIAISKSQNNTRGTKVADFIKSQKK